MLAVDTNIVVRYLTGDHPQQSARAKHLIDTADVLVPTTVLLETEWVLRSGYGFDRARIVEAITAFAGLPRVSIEHAAMIAQALDWTASGMDFADALHLAAAGQCEAFVSFDRRLVSIAEALGASTVREP